MKNKSPWHINILTLFPDMFPGFLGHSLAGQALDKGLWSYKAVDIRDFATDKHKTVDDTPFGGGAGMVMRADVIERALLSISTENNAQQGVRQTVKKKIRNIYLSPRGTPLTQKLAYNLTQETELTLLCGRYEGVDQRLLDAHGFEEISIGDYVLSGGEPAALILMDSCIRLLDGVMGNHDTLSEESFSNGLLEYPHYTKPAEWTDHSGDTHTAPEILRSGHHKKIDDWRYEQALKITRQRRPDLLTEKDSNAKTKDRKST